LNFLFNFCSAILHFFARLTCFVLLGPSCIFLLDLLTFSVGGCPTSR
jgi:hypothetical protein